MDKETSATDCERKGGGRENTADHRHPTARPDQAKRTYSAPIFSGCNSEWDWPTPGMEVLPESPKFWVPLIALFSGQRLNETLQLHRSDIVTEQGTLCFRLSTAQEGQRLQIAPSLRIIPVHAELLKIGFGAFIATKSGRLFASVEKASDGYFSSVLSKHFARFLGDLGLKRKGLSFHSFRHTFEDACRA